MPRAATLVSALERAARVSGRRTIGDGEVAPDVSAARATLSRWLVEGREAKGWTREHIARVTRIPLRTLENLEDARWDQLPADVFVRGFLRSYARSVGLSVDEALARYSGCGFEAAPVATVAAQALLDSMAALAPTSVARPMTSAPVTTAPRILGTAEIPAVAPEMTAPEMTPAGADARVDSAVDASAPTADSSLVLEAAAIAPRRTTKRAATVTGGRERDAKGRFVRKSVEMAAVVVPEEARAEAEALEAADAAAALAASTPAPALTFAPAPAEAASPESIAPVVVAPTAAAPTVTRVVPPRPSRPLAAPTLIIDDDHPEEAERTREDRARAKDGGWRSFLPPALLDQERGGRQGGLTLAVIILLIVATLTLSYLMRRPSSTGEGITARPSSTLVG